MMDSYSRWSPPRSIVIHSSEGALWYDAAKTPPGKRYGFSRSAMEPLLPRTPETGEPGIRRFGHLLGLSWFVTDGGTTNVIPGPIQQMSNNVGGPLTYFPHFTVVVRYSSLLGAFAALLFISLLAARRRRARPGMCTSCGYNLTGNASGVCPECGTAITQI